jgi:hypothetical protein
MTGRGVPDDEMPDFPRPRRPGTAGADRGEALDALLGGSGPPPEAAGPDLRPVAEALAALRGEPEPAELAGHARALAAFRARHGVPDASAGRPARPSLRAWVAAAATAAAMVTVGGFAAAYANMLPAPAQRIAHRTLGAPAPELESGPGRHLPTPEGTGSTGLPAAGLCHDYARALARGTAGQQAAVVWRVATEAGPEGIAAYCGLVIPAPPPPGQRAGLVPPGHAKTHVPPGQAKKKHVPPGQAKKKHLPGHSASQALGQRATDTPSLESASATPSPSPEARDG